MTSELDEHIMIEYHDTKSVVNITYEEFINAAHDVSNVLKNLETSVNNENLSHCIALNFDIEQYHIPILIKGIADSRFYFVFRPLQIAVDICKCLTINLIFSHTFIVGTEMIHQFNIHDKIILLLKYKYVIVNELYSLKNANILLTKLYYAITTSGTTGMPTIVKVSDKCILSNVYDFKLILDISEADKIAHLTPLTFDPSMIELLLAIECTCTMFMASKELQKYPQLLLNKMMQSKVTVLQTTPSLLLSRWSKENLKEQLLSSTTTLKALILGGEPFLRMDILSNIRQEGNTTRFFNAYGITEVSCWASLHEIIPESKTALHTRIDYLGKPLSNTLFEVRSNDNKIIKKGEGILYIGSSTRLCQLNEEIYNSNSSKLIYRNTGDIVKVDSDGNIFYIGRSDAIIKRLGHKVNINELEKCLTSCKFIEKGAVVWDEILHRLHICVVALNEVYIPSNLKTKLRVHLRTLSDHYQPDEIHTMKNIPLTEHGKVCKMTLKRICIQRTKPIEHLNDIVQNLWEEHLGTCDNKGFLMLGGTSVMALQMSNVFSDLLDIQMPELITIFLQDSTLTECLAFILKTIDERKLCKDTSAVSTATEREEPHTNLTNVPIVKEVEEVVQESTNELKCLWQKCRGDSHNSTERLQIEKAEIVRTYDLKKCVDASPCVFKYSSGEIFATVGSHSGIICTVTLSNTNLNDYYQVQLPDRVEASVLILDNCRGVVDSQGSVSPPKQWRSRHVSTFWAKRSRNFTVLTGHILWKYRTNDIIKCPALGCTVKNVLYVGSYDTYMYCLSTNDGEKVWKAKVSEGSISAKAQYNCEKNAILVGTLDGTCAALDCVSGQIMWRRQLKHPVFSSPAILRNDNVVFCTVIGNLFCFDIKRNTQMWTYSMHLNVFSYLVIHIDPVTDTENICFVAHDKYFRLECDTKEEMKTPIVRHNVKLRNSSLCTPWCDGNIAIVADVEGTIYVLDFLNGDILAESKLDGAVFSSPVMHDNFIVVGCRSNEMYVLKLL